MRLTLAAIVILLIATMTSAHAATYVENFDKLGGVVKVTPSSPFPKGWKNSGDLWGDDEDDWEEPWNNYNAGMSIGYTQSDVDAVKALDGQYSESSVRTSTIFFISDEKYAVQEFMFTASLDSTYLEVDAYVSDGDDGLQAYIWNFASNSWELYADYQSDVGWMWINFSTSSPQNYISPSGKVYVLLQSRAYVEWIGSDTAEVKVDYIQLLAVVPNASVRDVHINVTSSNLRNWGGVFDDDTVEVEVSAGVADYPIAIKGVWNGNYSFFASSFTDDNGNATIGGRTRDGGITEAWRTDFYAVAPDVMVGGRAYRGGEKIIARNVVVLPGSYSIELVGRFYYSGGADWIRVMWYIDSESVEKPYPIPAVQKFVSGRASVTIWKYGIDDYCADPSCDTEGIYGTYHDADWDGACIAFGSTTPYCHRDPHNACYREPGEEGHDCVYFSGYRVGPFIELNVPDHALGWLARFVINWGWGSLENFMRSTYYDQHEGPYGVVNRNAKCGKLNPSTEYSFTHGVLGIGKDPKGGLGVVGFVGLIADSQHAFGVMFGHRYGVHPFIAVLTTVPSYPSTKDGWENYREEWLGYFLSNVKYVLKRTGEEMAVWNLRYPGNDVVDLSRAFNDFLVDFIPYFKATLWIMVNSGKSVLHPFVVGVYVMAKDLADSTLLLVSNQTLNERFQDVVSTFLLQLPNITGPPDASTGFNYLLAKRNGLPYSERSEFAHRMMELVDQTLEWIIAVMKEIPQMEYTSTRDSPGWDWDWIAGCPYG